MRCITIREPYATLVAIEAKKIETRSWKAPDWLIGQRIAIHAAKGLTENEWSIAKCSPGFPEALKDSPWFWDSALPKFAFPETRGKVIATAVLADCLVFTPFNVSKIVAEFGAGVPELRFGDFTPGRYGWLLRDVQRLPEPIPARGELGIWTWDAPEGLVAA